MRVAVIGGTGSLGGLVVAELAARGDAVRTVSRRAPTVLAPEVEHRRADVRTGEGLQDALEGVDTVVDAVNDLSGDEAVLVEGTRRLLAAEAVAGGGHHVAISVVGCDRVPGKYSRTKLAQEEVVAGGPVAWSLLRATQFHPLIARMFAAAGRARVVPTGHGLLQPIAPSVVARLLADAVHVGPSGRLPEVGGPQVRTLSELAADWRAHTGRRLLGLRVPLVGHTGQALRDGAMCAPRLAVDGPTFAQWLAGEGVGVHAPVAR